MDKKEYFLLREGLIRSVLADIVTFGFIFGFALLNRFVLGDKWYYGIFFIFMILTSLLSRESNFKRFTSKEDLINYINKNI